MHLQINLILLFTHIVLVISFSELNLSGDNAINFNLDYKSPDNSASIFDADADADPALWPSEATVDSLGSSYEVSLSADPLTSMGPDDLFDVSNQDLLTDGSCSSAFENTINKRKDRELCAPPKSSELGPQTPGRGGIFDKEFFGELPIGYIPVPSPLEDEENYCPKDVIGKPMYMVCDSGVMQDRQMYYSRGTYTLYNVYRLNLINIITCRDPRWIWCCQFYFTKSDDPLLALDDPDYEEGDVAMLCEQLSPIMPPPTP